MRYKVSVIVATYNGEKKIDTLIKSLSSQTNLSFELIVIIDGSTDATRLFVESTATPFEKRIFEQENSGRSIARNSGFKHSNGDLLIFFDDDMELKPDSIERHVTFHQSNAGLLTGNQVDIYSKSKTDIQNYKAFLSEKWTEKYKDGLNRLDANNLFFTAATCSIKRTDFESLHGFNEALTDAEDYELALRALKLGLPIYFDKSLQAIHHDMITCSSYIKRQIQYDHAHKKLRQIGIDSNYNVWNDTLLKKIFYWFFSIKWWVELIDKTKILLFLPKPFRYKIYDWIIFSQSRVYPKSLN